MKRIYLAQRGQGLKRACHGKQLQLITALKKQLFEWRSLPRPLKNRTPQTALKGYYFTFLLYL